MKPLDPRLLRYARAARRYVILTAALGTVTALLVIAQSQFIARAIAPVINGTVTSISDVAPLIIAAAAVFLARALVEGAQERFAHRAARRSIGELRAEVLEHSVRLGPRWLARDGHGPDVTTLATRGLDNLEAYFIRYLPQLLLAATVTPATLIVIFWSDLTSGLIILVTIPLVPIFMILVGRMTQTFSAARLRTMQKLGTQVLDLLAGLATLRSLGRARGPGTQVRALADANRRASMSTLRVAFLSGMVLELLTTLSVALVAVAIGLRLVSGDLDLTTGLAVLILAPEVYFPIRQIGTQFHAASDGVAAADAAFAVIEEPLPARGTEPAPDLSSTPITVSDLSVEAPGRALLAPAGLSFTLEPGAVTALIGESGAGKSTTVLAILGLLEGTGTIRVGERELSEIDPDTMWPQIAWVPQRPAIIPGTVLDNVTHAVYTEADTEHEVPASILAAAEATGFDTVVSALPQGWSTPLGQGGSGLSLGQRQRLALTRALAANQPLVILDEPTAHLDSVSETQVLDAVRAMSKAGRTVLVIAHRPALVRLADHVVTVESAGVGNEDSVRTVAAKVLAPSQLRPEANL